MDVSKLKSIEDYKIEHNGCTAYVFKSCEEGVYQMNSLYTKPEHRRKGSAKEVVNKAIEIAKNNNCVLQIFVGAYADQPINNEKLTSFYKTIGFEIHRITKSGTAWMRTLKR